MCVPWKVGKVLWMIQIEMSVIKQIQNFNFNNFLQFGHINDHSSERIDLSLHCNLQFVVVSVSVGVIAFTVNTGIF